MAQLYVYGFEASPNVRDLGGYDTKDGKVTKHQCVVRGVSVASFESEHDRELFDYFGFKTIMDFRSTYEVKQLPDPEFEGVNLIHSPGMRMESGEEIDFSPEGIKNIFEVAKANGVNLNQQVFFDHYYKKMLYNTKTFGEMFRVLLNEEGPLYIHCAAGKDRTGVGAALILLALGVSKEDVIADYNVTNHVLWPYIEKKLEANKEAIEKYPKLEKEIIKTYGVDSTLLESELNKIENEYGSFEKFFNDVYSLSDEDLNRLRVLYTN